MHEPLVAWAFCKRLALFCHAWVFPPISRIPSWTVYSTPKRSRIAVQGENAVLDCYELSQQRFALVGVATAHCCYSMPMLHLQNLSFILLPWKSFLSFALSPSLQQPVARSAEINPVNNEHWSQGGKSETKRSSGEAVNMGEYRQDQSGQEAWGRATVRSSAGNGERRLDRAICCCTAIFFTPHASFQNLLLDLTLLLAHLEPHTIVSRSIV
eukprot:697336-Amphidinium_carterae.2